MVGEGECNQGEEEEHVGGVVSAVEVVEVIERWYVDVWERG